MAPEHIVRRGSVALGMLDYTLYNYAYCLFGTAFNRFFLIYVALFTFSMLALIFALANIKVKGLQQRFRDTTPAKWIASYMLFVAVGIGGLWIVGSLSFIVTGQVPEFINKVAHPTSVVFALDLSLVVPFLILGAIWLWKRQPWGYLLAAILNVKGAAYMLTLATVSISAVQAGFFSRKLGRAPAVGPAQPRVSGGESIPVGECTISGGAEG